MKTVSFRSSGILSFLFALGILLALPVKGEIVYFSNRSFLIPANSDGKSLSFDWSGRSCFRFAAGPLRTLENTAGNPHELSYYVTLFGNAEILSQNSQAAIVPEGTLLDGETVSWTNLVIFQAEHSNAEIIYTVTNQATWSNSPSSTLATVSFSPQSDMVKWTWYGPGNTGATSFGAAVNQAEPQGYLGVYFYAADGPHYGWIRIELPAGNAKADGPVILDWAYETIPNTPIAAGQISETVNFSATLSGANEIPPNENTIPYPVNLALRNYVDASVLSYDLTFDLSFQPISAGVFGPATPFENSANLFHDLGDYTIVTNLEIGASPATAANIYPFDPSPIYTVTNVAYSGQMNLNQREVGELMQGEFYLNFATTNYPQGELRGVISPPSEFFNTTYNFDLRGSTEVPPNHSPYRGSVSLELSPGNLVDAWVMVNYGLNVTYMTLNHLTHQAAAPLEPLAELETTADIFYPDLYNPGPGWSGNIYLVNIVPLNDQQVYWLQHEQLYFNVSSSQYPDGEIGAVIKQSP